MHVGYREGVWTFSKYFSLNVSPSLQDILFGQRNSFTPTALHMWAVASSFNYLLFLDFVFKDWVTAFLHIILERFISKSISFAFCFSCHFRYASNFGSFSQIFLTCFSFPENTFHFCHKSVCNITVDYSLFLFSSFPRISSRFSFLIDVTVHGKTYLNAYPLDKQKH